MTKTIIGILAFGAGCAVGFYGAKRMLEQKYEQMISAEVDAVKRALRKYRKEKSEYSEKPEALSEQEREEYVEQILDAGYAGEKDDLPFDVPPHIITPEEFGELDEYERISLTYYSDGVLADDDNRAMSDAEIEYAVGKKSLKRFAELDEDSEEDAVYVRNDHLKVDYEIIRDLMTYEEILKRQPYLAL